MSSVLTLNGNVLVANGAAILGEIDTGTVQTNKTYTVAAAGTPVIQPDTGYDSMQKVTLTVPAGTATAPSTITGNSASITTGSNTLTFSKNISVTPTVSAAGYVSTGVANTVAVSLTANVTTKGATTYTPSSTAQTIPAGTYLTGAQTIVAIQSASGVSF